MKKVTREERNKALKEQYRIYVRGKTLKGQCHEIFDLYFFHESNPSGAPDKQAKMVFLKNLFSRRYSNLKFEKFDSAQANTARSQNFLTS